MRMTQILGAVALVIGLVLLGFAYHASNAPMEQVSDALTGRYTNQTMWYLILGIAPPSGVSSLSCSADGYKSATKAIGTARGTGGARSVPDGGNEIRKRQ